MTVNKTSEVKVKETKLLVLSVKHLIRVRIALCAIFLVLLNPFSYFPPRDIAFCPFSFNSDTYIVYGLASFRCALC